MRRGSWGALGSLWSCEAGREVSQGIPSQQCAIGLLNAVLVRAMASEASRKKQVAESMAFQIFSRHNPVPSQIWAKMQIIVYIVVMSVRDFHRVPRRFFCWAKNANHVLEIPAMRFAYIYVWLHVCILAWSVFRKK